MRTSSEPDPGRQAEQDHGEPEQQILNWRRGVSPADDYVSVVADDREAGEHSVVCT